MDKIIFYWEQIKKYSKILYATTIKYYTITRTFCIEHTREIVLSVAYIPFVGWLYPLYAFEHDAEVQKHAKRGLLYAMSAIAIALAIFVIIFITPRPWRVVRFTFTILLYINYLVYYAIVTLHIYHIWKKKDFSIPKIEFYLEKLEQYI